MGKVGTEATLQEIKAAIGEGKMYLKTVAMEGKWVPENIVRMKNISDAGLARKYFNIGDQVIVEYKNTAGTVYEMPWDVVHIGDAVLADGTIKKDAIYLQSHWATNESMQFDAAEVEIATEATATAGLYYYGYDGTNYTLLNLAAGDEIPYASYTKVYHNEIKDTSYNILSYGYNRETHSAYGQWLNSAGLKGNWWTPQHIGDCAPSNHGTINGFLAGLPKDFVSSMSEVQIRALLNTISEPDKNSQDEMYTAKVFLPHLEQMYIAPYVAGVEGESWDYYKQLAGDAGLTGMFQRSQTYPILISYALENHSSAQYVRLASANRGGSYYTWYVSSSGFVGYNSASSAYRCRPACVI